MVFCVAGRRDGRPRGQLFVGNLPADTDEDALSFAPTLDLTAHFGP